jgi:phospholipid/cholesterol/gamma-HCH transport system permease protein
MVGVLVLREVGVLIVCIMVAGGRGAPTPRNSAPMRMREEVDALRTMGFDPVEVLILPRIIALVIAVPTLTFLGSMAALYWRRPGRLALRRHRTGGFPYAAARGSHDQHV